MAGIWGARHTFFPVMAGAAMLPGVKPRSEVRTHWFSTTGAVRRREDGVFEVTVSGVCIGQFSRSEPERRNLLLVALADNPDIRLGDLARAFGLTAERLRQIRQVAREQGVEALFVKPRRGRAPLPERLRKRLVALFEAGLNIDEAYAQVKRSTSRASVGRVYKEWKAAAKATKVAEPAATPVQLSLLPEPEPTADRDVVPRVARSRERRVTREIRVASAVVSPSAVEQHRVRYVQHVGTWLMVGRLHADGLYDAAEDLRSGGIGREDLRAALDTTVMALALGQRCVEGVRRLATPSASTLLLRPSRPSAKWTREVLHEFAEEGAVPLHLDRAARHAKLLAETTPHRVVIYVDNHLRKYTGKHVIRKGWRMQEKRVVPGVTDYYAHDHEGRPVMRVDTPEHAHIVQVLRPIARFLRAQMGTDRSLLLVFDRAGALPAEMAALRDEGVEFVTYERKPYPAVPVSKFADILHHGKDQIRWCEERMTNLGVRRGRVRRVALLMPDGAQVNVLASSSAPAPELVTALLHRWGRQENQFKHGKERWGINQLDGRRVEPYPASAVIPNPARRRLELDLHDARRREGDALRELAHLSPEHARNQRLAEAARGAFAEQEALVGRRRFAPTHAPLRNTELAGKLRRHPGRYKVVIDTLRIALAVAETDLAALLARHLRRPREAKRVLQNLLAAPGSVTFRTRSINVCLQPAATPNEWSAFATFLRQVNAMRLTLPGDPCRRPLHFRTAKP